MSLTACSYMGLGGLLRSSRGRGPRRVHKTRSLPVCHAPVHSSHFLPLGLNFLAARDFWWGTRRRNGIRLMGTIAWPCRPRGLWEKEACHEISCILRKRGVPRLVEREGGIRKVLRETPSSERELGRTKWARHYHDGNSIDFPPPRTSARQ